MSGNRLNDGVPAEDDMEVFSFESDKVMPSYLVAMAVGNLE